MNASQPHQIILQWLMVEGAEKEVIVKVAPKSLGNTDKDRPSADHKTE